jgi:serine/threonine protein kinase
MEYCRYGDLYHCLCKRSFLPFTEVQELTRQLLEGLDHMHQNDFAHRDLKPGVSQLQYSLIANLTKYVEYSYQSNATQREVVGSTC